MHKTLKTSIVAIALAGGGTIGIGTLASASYGGESPTTETPTDTESVAPQGLQAAPDASTGDQPEGDGNGPRGRHGARNSEAIAEALGMTTEEFHESRGAGQSIADIAAAQGVDISVVEQAILSDIQEHITAGVAEGDIPQDEADAKLADAEERITEMVNRVPGEGESDRESGPLQPRGPRSADTIAETLGLTVDELQAARAAGQSVADVAAAQGVDVDTVVQAIVDDVEAHLAAEVAEGDITQEEADAKLAGAEEHVTERVNTVPGEGDGHRGPGGPGGRRGPGTDAPVPEAGV